MQKLALEHFYSTGSFVHIDKVECFVQRLEAFTPTHFKHNVFGSFTPTRVADRPNIFHWLDFSLESHWAPTLKPHIESWLSDISSCAESACKTGNISIGLHLRTPGGDPISLWLGSEVNKDDLSTCRFSFRQNGFLFHRAGDGEVIRCIEEARTHVKERLSSLLEALPSLWRYESVQKISIRSIPQAFAHILLDRLSGDLVTGFSWRAGPGIHGMSDAHFDALQAFPSRRYELSGTYRIDQLHALDFVHRLSPTLDFTKHAIGNFASLSGRRSRLEVWTNSSGHRLVVVSRIPLPLHDLQVLSVLAEASIYPIQS